MLYFYIFGIFFIVLVIMIAICRANIAKPGKRSLSSIPCVGLISVKAMQASSPNESIHYRKVGHGKKLLVLLPGNNTSGQVYDGVLNQFRSEIKLNTTYTVITFDYRGSGKSSYNSPITALSDFAGDIDRALSEFTDIKNYQVSVVGYSIGFPVGIELIKINPRRYLSLIGVSPVGTRGIRAEFNAGNTGVDPQGKEWQEGDWLPTDNPHSGVGAAAFHQRDWQGSNRSFLAIKRVWDSVVFNDALKFDPVHNLAGVVELYDNPAYTNALSDCQNIQNMPEALFYVHNYNASGVAIGARKNSDGELVEIETTNNIEVFSGKRILLVKAKTDLDNWRGDLVVDDESFATTFDDFSRIGARVDSVHIAADQGYDHGLVITRPAEIAALIDTFIGHELSAASANKNLAASTVFRSNAVQ